MWLVIALAAALAARWNGGWQPFVPHFPGKQTRRGVETLLVMLGMLVIWQDWQAAAFAVFYFGCLCLPWADWQNMDSRSDTPMMMARGVLQHCGPAAGLFWISAEASALAYAALGGLLGLAYWGWHCIHQLGWEPRIIAWDRSEKRECPLVWGHTTLGELFRGFNAVTALWLVSFLSN